MRILCAYTELMDINELTPHPENNNEHPSEQVDALIKVIDFNGWTSPITIAKKSFFSDEKNVVTRGHLRLLAAEQMGDKKVPVQIIEYRDKAHEYADLTADNEIARWSTFNKEKAQLMLESLPDLPLDALGIKEFEIDVMPDYSEKNKEVDLDNFGNDLEHTCPKCGFEFNE